MLVAIAAIVTAVIASPSLRNLIEVLEQRVREALGF
jgi:hypothetical protein